MPPTGKENYTPSMSGVHWPSTSTTPVPFVYRPGSLLPLQSDARDKPPPHSASPHGSPAAFTNSTYSPMCFYLLESQQTPREHMRHVSLPWRRAMAGHLLCSHVALHPHLHVSLLPCPGGSCRCSLGPRLLQTIIPHESSHLSPR